MKRRDFIAWAGGAMAWPLAARAQQAPMPIVAYLHSGLRSAPHDGFRQGLNDAGFAEGRNVTIEWRYAAGQYDQLPQLAADLARRVNVLGAFGAAHTALAAKAATSTVPIVFAIGSDPVQFGLVTSLNKPGGNVTGVSFFAAELEAKRLGLLKSLVPDIGAAGALINPTNANAQSQTRQLNDAARTLGIQLHIIGVSRDNELETAFTDLQQRRVRAVVVASDPFFSARRTTIVGLAAHRAIAAIYEWREFVEAGGLASYGTNLTNNNRQAGVYAGRILRGEKPADLPVIQATKFEFVLNLKTAKALNLDIPNAMQLLADEVIE